MPVPNLNYSNIQTPTPNPNPSPNTEPLNTVDFFPLDEISGYHLKPLHMCVKQPWRFPNPNPKPRPLPLPQPLTPTPTHIPTPNL